MDANEGVGRFVCAFIRRHVWLDIGVDDVTASQLQINSNSSANKVISHYYLQLVKIVQLARLNYLWNCIIITISWRIFIQVFTLLDSIWIN